MYVYIKDYALQVERFKGAHLAFKKNIVLPSSDFFKNILQVLNLHCKTTMYIYKTDLSDFSWLYMWKKKKLNFGNLKYRCSQRRIVKNILIQSELGKSSGNIFIA